MKSEETVQTHSETKTDNNFTLEQERAFIQETEVAKRLGLHTSP